MSGRDNARGGEAAKRGSSSDKQGLFSRIRLGKHRCRQDLTSSPTISHPIGNYVWDFLNWGFTTPYGLEEFSKVTPNEKDIVPYGNMDQGRLFVRVSVQDLSTLQLAYQRGLAALQRAQTRVERLSEENHRLQAMVKNWSIKTTALTNESIELRQEIANIKQRMRACTVAVDEHQALIQLLCEKICSIFDQTCALPNSGLTFDELVRIVFSLPPLVQEKLAECCPSFKIFMESNDSGMFIRMQMHDAKNTIQKILDLLPKEMETAVLNSVIKDVQLKHDSISMGLLDFIPRQRSNTDPRDSRRKPIRMSVSQSREDNTLMMLSDVQKTTSTSGERPELPPRNYSMEEMTVLEDQGNFTSGNETTTETATRTRNTNEPIYQEIKIKNNNQDQDPDRSGSSSLGAPLAHSTPCGTMSRLVSTRHQIYPSSSKKPKKKKRKVSKWNFAAKFCGTGKSSTISDSESFDATANPVMSRQLPIQNKLTRQIPLI